MTTRPDGFFPVALETLECSESFPFDLYIRSAAHRGATLYLAAGQPLSDEGRGALRSRSVRTLYIARTALDAYSQFLQEALLTDAPGAVAARFSVIHETHRAVFLERLASNDVPGVVATAAELGESFVNLVCDHEAAFVSLLGVLSHDYYTYTHLTNVGVCSAALAQALGIADRDSLVQIATGGLLHDLGKRHIDTELLHKAGRLSRSEFQVMQHHSQLGFEELCERDDLSWAQLMMVYQHHERMAGGGYPTGVDAEAIHPWSRICAVADVYDALTSHRPYRDPMTTREVCAYLESQAGSALDKEMVACWISQLQPTCSTSC